jgi:hypothetical protein
MITIYDCTQKSFIGYKVYLNLDKKQVRFVDNNNDIKKVIFDTIILIGLKKFIIKNSNMSIFCKSDEKISEFAIDRSFVIRRNKKI